MYLFLTTNESRGIQTLYYLDTDGKIKHEINENDPNIFTESQKRDREQGSLKLFVNPKEIYEESKIYEKSKNIFQITVEYNLIADEAILMIILTSKNPENTGQFINPRQFIENKVVLNGQDTLKYSVPAMIEISSYFIEAYTEQTECFIEAYFKQKEGDKIFAYNKQNIAVKEPKYMSEPIPDARTMQIILTQTAANAARRAESDFPKADVISQQYADLRTLLTLITRFSSVGSIFVYPGIYPLQVSIKCNEIIEDWQYVSRKRFENAVFIQVYMETIARLQRRLRY
jgi:hypothetical protein